MKKIKLCETKSYNNPTDLILKRETSISTKFRFFLSTCFYIILFSVSSEVFKFLHFSSIKIFLLFYLLNFETILKESNVGLSI